jgi:Uncharacterised nucleotidyltransferase
LEGYRTVEVQAHLDNVVSFGDDVLERMVLAVEQVRERLKRAVSALEAAGVPYAVIGGNAVAAWVSRVDPAAVRNTADVDILVDRADFNRTKSALESAGFVFRHVMGIDMFLDGPKGRPRDAVHVVFAGEKVRKEYIEPAPDLSTTDRHEAFCVLGFEPLVRMKLTSFRDKDRTHLRDLIEVGLLDRSWIKKLPVELGARLQELLDNPDG